MQARNADTLYAVLPISLCKENSDQFPQIDFSNTLPVGKEAPVFNYPALTSQQKFDKGMFSGYDDFVQSVKEVFINQNETFSKEQFEDVNAMAAHALMMWKIRKEKSEAWMMFALTLDMKHLD